MKNYLVIFLTLTLIACGPPDNKPTVKEEFHPNGELKKRTNYQSKDDGGRKHGIDRSWHENGQLATEGTYVDGRKHGVSRAWHESGHKRVEIFYKDGVAHGVRREWRINGQLEREYCWENGDIVDMSNCQE